MKEEGKKFNFIPASQFNAGENYRYEVTLSKGRKLLFTQHVIDTYNLANKILKFYLDVDQNTIGWCVMRSGKLDDFKKTRGMGVKKLSVIMKKGEQNGGVCDIDVELRKLKLNLDKITTKRHLVHSYKSSSLLEEDQIDYITLDEYAK